MARRIVSPTNGPTFTTVKAATAEIGAMQARFPGRTYELRVMAGGRYYIVCTAGAPTLVDRLAAIKAVR